MSSVQVRIGAIGVEAPDGVRLDEAVLRSRVCSLVGERLARSGVVPGAADSAATVRFDIAPAGAAVTEESLAKEIAARVAEALGARR